MAEASETTFGWTDLDDDVISLSAARLQLLEAASEDTRSSDRPPFNRVFAWKTCQFCTSSASSLE
jgi:hypothetical protein